MAAGYRGCRARLPEPAGPKVPSQILASSQGHAPEGRIDARSREVTVTSGAKILRHLAAGCTSRRGQLGLVPGASAPERLRPYWRSAMAGFAILRPLHQFGSLVAGPGDLHRRLFPLKRQLTTGTSRQCRVHQRLPATRWKVAVGEQSSIERLRRNGRPVNPGTLRYLIYKFTCLTALSASGLSSATIRRRHGTSSSLGAHRLHGPLLPT
jgi:hypothetical protein